ncbi:RNA polymerase sigma factor [Planctomycetota bacterium]
MLKDTNLQQAIIRAHRGDTEALGELYNHYYAKMVWLAYAILLDQNLAEDVAQQSFVTACEKICYLRNPECFGAWLGRICQNEALQNLREMRRPAHHENGVYHNAHENHQDNGLIEMVRRAIDRLPSTYREVVVLRYYQQMTYVDISDFLTISVASVRSRLFHAKRKIKRYLKQHGFIYGRSLE